ncbi:MAG TPA: diaminopimelate epimerase [Alphaproteobacteria bacterium]|nr:diaminopimelate epimerase [Alphaproteobacteria bacterium]
MLRSFLKMHGLGNDFVIFDGRQQPFKPAKEELIALADRRRGIGYDQLIVMLKPKSPGADVYLDMYNSDGSAQCACGNVTRCIARLLFSELGRKQAVIETVAGLLPVYEDAPGLIAVDFGPPRLGWKDIPLAKPVADTLHVPLALGPLDDPCCVNMGNPHAVFFVPDTAKIPLGEIGPKLEYDPLFPDRCNIEIAQIIAADRIRMRVWERGAGITPACGSGACATLVAAVRRGLSARRAAIAMDGGDVFVEWRADDHVILTGPTAIVYRGELDDEFLAAIAP